MISISRRKLLQLAAASGAASVGPIETAYAHPDGYGPHLPAVIDASENITRAVDSLKARGVKVVIRYFALANNLPEKIIRRDEANAILQAGLSLAVSYQFHNDDINTFRASRAKRDADKCIELANAIDQPRGTAIYFGVDDDWTSKADTDAIANYFGALKDHSAFRERGFRIGVYGSGFTCHWLRRRELAEFFWIAGLSDGWSDREKFVKSQKWNMYQNALEVAAEPDREDTQRIDTNIVNPRAGLIGSFSRPTAGPNAGKVVADGVISNDGVVENHRIVAKETVLYQRSNGTSEIRRIKASKIVSIVEPSGQFLLVDVPRQVPKDPKVPKSPMIADFQRGYCRISDLAKIGEFTN